MSPKLFPLDPRQKVRIELLPQDDHPEGVSEQDYLHWKEVHAKAVRQLASRAADSLKLRAAHHDSDKIAEPAKFSKPEVVGTEVNKELKAAKLAHKRQRHHVLDTSLKTDLLDWIEACADWVATSVAKKSEQWLPDDTPDNRERLWTSMLHTIKIMRGAAVTKEPSKSNADAVEIGVVPATSIPASQSAVADEPETAAAAIQESGDFKDPSEVVVEDTADKIPATTVGKKSKKKQKEDNKDDMVDQSTLQTD